MRIITAISSDSVKPKELDRLKTPCFSSIRFTENLNSCLEGPQFTCIQCMINNKNLESYNFFFHSSFLCVTAP